MKLAVILTDFPKTTDTRILRDMNAILAQGVDLRIYHLTPWKRREILHAFGQSISAHVWHVPAVGGDAAKALSAAPRLSAGIAGDILAGLARNPLTTAKSLGLMPAALGVAGQLADWGATHVHAAQAGHAATAAWIINRARGIPYSVDCFGDALPDSPHMTANILKAAAAVRSDSCFGRTALANRFAELSVADISVIHTGVEFAANRRPDAPPCSPFSILHVGALQKRKGLNVLLDALSGFDRPDWVLKLVGDGPERARLQAQVVRLGLHGRVQFLGAKSWVDVARHYARASVCVAPLISQPTGENDQICTSMIEALAFRRPVISTRVGGMAELIKDGESGRLVAPGDVAALRRALTDIFDSPSAALRMADAGRAHVQAEFDVRQAAQRQLAMFMGTVAHETDGPNTPYLRLVQTA